MRQKFRAHHILCTSLYEGKGYSGAFCDHMSAVVERLRGNPDEELILVAEPDLICARCPNNNGNGECAQDHNRVVDKDRRVLRSFELEEGQCYTYRALCGHARAHLTEDVFAELCGTCEWHRQGLCHYEDLIASLTRTYESPIR